MTIVHHSPQCKVAVSADDNVTYITFEGDVTYNVTDDIKRKLYDLQQETDSYVLDMSSLTSIDSTGLGMLAGFVNRYVPDHKQAFIVVQDNFIKEIFSIARFDSLFHIVDKVEQALHMISNGGKLE